MTDTDLRDPGLGPSPISIAEVRHRLGSLPRFTFGVLGIVVVQAALFGVLNLVVDLLYFAVDPRLRIDRRTAAAR